MWAIEPCHQTTGMSLGDLIQDAAAWVSEEIQKSIDDLTESVDDDDGAEWSRSRVSRQSPQPEPIAKAVWLEEIQSWGDQKLVCDDLVCGGAGTPEGSTATQTPTNFSAGVKEVHCCGCGLQPFRRNADLNTRLYLYEGDICSVRTDCIMCFTTDGFASSDGLAARLLHYGGDDLYEELSQQEPCRAGEARLCRLFNLPAMHVVYTVTPRFTNKYVTATHNALNSSIRESLILMKESRLRTIAIPCLPPNFASLQRSESLNRRAGPDQDHDAAVPLGGDYAVMHTVLRTIRRWMEKLQGDIDAVVLVVPNPKDAAVYRKYMAAYFPRDHAEELNSPLLLPPEVGNDSGEIDVAERRIPIIKKDARPSDLAPGSRIREPVFGGMLAPREHSDSESDDDSGREIVDSNDVSFLVARTETETEKRLEALNLRRLRGRHPDVGLESTEALYQTYLRQANKLALSPAGVQLQQLQFIYPSGCDNAGRPIIVFLAAVFPAATVDSFILLLHIIRTLDPFIRDKYTLLYVNSDVHHSNAPSMSLWSEFFGLMEKFEDNLDQLLVLHPGLLFKAAFACCWPYLASHVWNGTVYMKSIKDLSHLVGSQMPYLPKYVVEYDVKPKPKFLGLTL